MPLAKRFFSLIFKVTVLINLVICSLVYAFRKQIAYFLTNGSDKEVSDMVASVLRLIAVLLVIDML